MIIASARLWHEILPKEKNWLLEPASGLKPFKYFWFQISLDNDVQKY